MQLDLTTDELEFIKKLIIYYQVDYGLSLKEEKLENNIVQKINKISSGIK